MSDKSIPRMRTAARAAAELKAMDPGCGVSEYYIRQLIRTEAVPIVWAGCKALVNLDDIIDLLQTGTPRPIPEPSEAVNGIRRLDARIRPGEISPNA